MTVQQEPVAPIQVPLALRAEIRLPFGPFEVPVRTAVVMLVALPLAVGLFALSLPFTYQAGGAILVLGFASALSRPSREGVWLGTWLAYRRLEPLLTRSVRAGRPRAGAVRRLGGHLLLPDRDRSPLPAPWGMRRWTRLPRLREAGDGVLVREPGGWSALLELGGPGGPPMTREYAMWGRAVMDWLQVVGCPAQLHTEVVHSDRSHVQQAFDRSSGRERTVLADYERELACHVAEHGLAARHYLVLTPRWAGPDGIPCTNRPFRITRMTDAARGEAERVRDLALRQAETLGLDVSVPPADEIARLMGRTPIGCEEATFFDGEGTIDSRHLRYGAVTELPGRTLAGSLMSAMIRARTRGTLSCYLFPVQTSHARKELRRQRSLYEALWYRSASPDAEMLSYHARQLDEMLLARQTSAVRFGIAVSVEADTPEGADRAFERLQTALMDEDMVLDRITAPTCVAAVAAAPGGLPLNRALFLTTTDVAACMLAGQGSAFHEPGKPLVGTDASTAATCWYSVFDQDNYSALIIGSSGSGKSVAAKTLLARHFLQGADVLVMDPESEYGPLVAALGGEYVELGDRSLNAFAIDPAIGPEEAAAWVTRVLSVLAGEERDYRNNRPVRALAGQDMAWLFGEVAAFIRDWRQARRGEEALLSDFCEHLDGPAMERAKRLDVEGRTRRCADIGERLRAYTQGDKGLIFDRPSTVRLTGPAVGVGLYQMASQVGADLTPALVFVLAALLGELRKMDRRRIILVDEAHRILADPDAGEVLADVVRTSRKRGAGVWMVSQSIRDFLGGGGDRPAPGEVLATVAATKLVLGVEHGVEQGVRQTFQLSDRELAAITGQRQPGRGVLIAGSERAIVDILPGDHLLPIVSTDVVRQDPMRGLASP